jgi:hypothetical protein
MLYAAKCYWPGVTQADLEQIADRAARAGLAAGSGGVAYLGALLFAADDLVLCLFRGHSRAAVIRASDRLGIPRERLMDSLWLGPGRRIREGTQQCPTTDTGLYPLLLPRHPRFRWRQEDQCAR